MRWIALAGCVLWVGGVAAASGYDVTWATYFGGSQFEQPREIIVLPTGGIVIGGQTRSEDLPVTPGAAQPKYGGEPAGSGHPGGVGGDWGEKKPDPHLSLARRLPPRRGGVICSKTETQERRAGEFALFLGHW